jgi:hypothetical protein
MIRAHPDAPVAPVLIEKPRGVGGQAIALGKRFHFPLRMMRSKGIAKCARIQAVHPAPAGLHPKIAAAIKNESAIHRGRWGTALIVESTVRRGGAT